MKMKKIFGFASMLVAMCAASVFTSCSDDDDDTAEETLNLEGITAVANADGTITIKGTVVTDTKLKSLELINEKGEPINLLAEKNIKEKDENGVKTFTTTLEENKVPVGIYTLSANQKKSGKGSVVIGETYELLCGAGKNSKLGSYVSFFNKANYTKDQVEIDENIAAVVEVICNDEGQFVISSSAKNASTVNYPKTKIFNSKSEEVESATKGTVISSDECIATFSIDKDSESEDATIKGIRIISKKGVLTVDTSILGDK